MFTIEVKKKGKDEGFSFTEVVEGSQVIHEDCYGGKVEWNRNAVDGYDVKCWDFYCTRCGADVQIRDTEFGNAKLEIVQTAIDSQERKLSNDVRVVQKI